MRIGVDADVTDETIPITDLARAVEGAGLDSLFVTQRIHLPASRGELLDEEGHQMDASLLDPFVALAAAAAVTARIRLGTGACYAALYDPLILAKQVSTLDQVSAGRFLFGITPGWLEEEVRNHGVDPARRWDVMREKVLAMQALWTGQDVEFHGAFVNFDPVRVGLRPVQRPHPPILVGSQGLRGMRHAVEYGDEWFPVVGPSTDLATDLAELAKRAHEAGRSRIPVTAFLWELDEDVVRRCAEQGVHRCVVYAFPDRRETIDLMLQRCSRLATRFRD